MSFLKNYFNIDCSFVSSLDKFDVDVSIVVGSQFSKYIWFILRNKKQFKLFIHLSDEKLRLSSILFYLFLPRRFLILRHYFDDTFNLNTVKNYLKLTFSKTCVNLKFQLLPHLIIGVWKALKFYAIKLLRINLYRLPLGYTDNFFNFMSSSHLSLPLNKFDYPKWSDFYGVKGNINRIIAMTSLSNHLIKIHQNLMWGGDKKYLVSNYVNALSVGNLSFNPPGYVSTESYRFFESLFLGNAPVNLPISTNSLGQNSNDFFIDHASTWSSLVEFYESLNRVELIDLISYQNYLFDQEIANLNEKISYLLQ